MSRKPRCIPPCSLVEITSRTIGGLFLLRPSDEVNEIIGGILARYARVHNMRVVFWIVLSGHYHALLIPDDADHLAAFMRDVQSQIAKEIGRLHGWQHRFWGRRFDAIPVAGEEASQIDRLTYLVSQSTKEFLVSETSQWPGIHAANNIASGEPIQGIWHDRTLEGRQSRCGKSVDPGSVRHVEILELEQLPCWQHLSAEDYRARVAEIVEQVERQAARRRAQEGKSCLERERVLRQDPLGAPKKSARSPRPLFHAISESAREAMREAFKAFYDAFFLASAEFLEGKMDVVFPDGSFPPARPFFVGARAGPVIF